MVRVPDRGPAHFGAGCDGEPRCSRLGVRDCRLGGPRAANGGIMSCVASRTAALKLGAATFAFTIALSGCGSSDPAGVEAPLRATETVTVTPTVTATPKQQKPPAAIASVPATPKPAPKVTLKPKIKVKTKPQVEATKRPAPTTRPSVRKPKPQPTATTRTTAPRPTATATPTATSTKSTGATYYKNCTAVRAAGADPIYRGQPGYGSHLDRDGDGVACE